MKFKLFLENKKEFDRLEYYYRYFKNLTPKGFVIKKEKDQIVIKIK
jgi:hypothetical protein